VILTRHYAQHAAPRSPGSSSITRTPDFSGYPVTSDLSIVPKIYHVFNSPPLHRVFFEESSLARKEKMKLKAEVNSLNALVTLLKRDKDPLTDRCDAALTLERSALMMMNTSLLSFSMPP
jgi:hypothetical protein